MRRIVITEDWTHYNRAVRDLAEGRTPPPDHLQRPPEPPKIVTLTPAKIAPIRPDPAPAGQGRAEPATTPTPTHTPASTNTASTNTAPAAIVRILDATARLLGVITLLVAIIGLIWFLSRNIPARVAATPPPTPPDASPVVTNFTQFNTVPFRNFFVTTGWVFNDNSETTPSLQYCYLALKNAGGERRFDLEQRPGGAHEPPDTAGLDPATWREARSKCVWKT